MTYLIAFVIAAIVGMLLVWTGLWWALPILAVAFVVYMAREMRKGMATRERPKRTEPTGVPRSSAAGNGGSGGTANERVGQA